MQFVMPRFQPDELRCLEAPRGQLSAEASAALVAERIRRIDEAGEDCRNRLMAVASKIEAAQSIVEQVNETKGDDR